MREAGLQEEAATIRDKGYWLLLCVTVVMLTRQMQLRDYNYFLVGATAGIAFLGWSVIAYKIVSLSFTYFVLCFLLGLMSGAGVSDALRFLAILLFTLSAFLFKPHDQTPKKLLIAIGLVQAGVVIGIGGYLGVIQDASVAAAIRVWANDVLQMGDVYSFNGVYYRVQLIGNALLPFFFCLTLHFRNEGKWMVLSCGIFTIALIFAGNLTYWAASAAYTLYEFRSYLRNPLVALIAIVGIFFVTSSAIVTESTSAKFSEDDGSAGIRVDQISVILDRMERHPYGAIFGFGLGQRIPDGQFRNYSEYLYIELQAAYVFYQIGLIGMTLYALSFVGLAYKCLNDESRPILFAYIFASISNPYIFDSNQVFVTAFLSALSVTRSNREFQ